MQKKNENDTKSTFCLTQNRQKQLFILNYKYTPKEKINVDLMTHLLLYLVIYI